MGQTSPESSPESNGRPGTAGAFNTTHWSVVLNAGESDSDLAGQALEELCQTYWYPLYAYIRRQGRNPQEAEDLTQGFLARFIERKFLKLADPQRGRFRSFLLTSLKHFMIDAWEKEKADKRRIDREAISRDGVDPEKRYLMEPVEPTTPDQLYEKRWASVLLDSVLDRLRAEYERTGRVAEFDRLKHFVWGNGHAGTYAEVAVHLNMQENAVKVAVHRLRNRFRDQLRQEVLRTVASPDEVDEELRHLRTLLSS